jgi:hypothetical protein
MLAAVALMLCLAPRAQAQSDSAIVIGFTTRLHSQVLQEDRPVQVYLPPGASEAARTGTRYPVMYLLDGDAHFHHATGIVEFLASTGRAPQMIVIAVPNTERTRDLTPRARADSAWMTSPTGERRVARFPGQGGADAFLRFLVEELAPWVDARYPTAAYRVLVGHSFGGLFAVHAALRRPDSFNAYVAVSPSLWWDEGRLIQDAGQLLATGNFDGRFLFMTMGTEGPDMNGSIDQLAGVLRANAPSGLEWKYQQLASDNHGTTPHRTLYDALESLFTGWELPQDAFMSGDVARVDAHFASMRDRFSFVGRTPEEVLNQMGYVQLQQANTARAAEIFRENVARYPESPNVYDSLGDALMAAGDVAGAVEQYAEAVERGEKTGHASLTVFRTNLENARKRLEQAQP